MKQVLILAILLYCTALVKAENEQVPNELLVIGGVSSKITEVVNPSNFKAETTSLDLNVRFSVGFHLNGNPTVCGGLFEGKVTSKCLSLSNGPAWNETFELETPRRGASSIQINDNKALVIGGFDPFSRNVLNTLETITSEGASQSSKTLPFKFSYGCATKINANEGIIIGGLQDGEVSSKTWIINLSTLDLKAGPKLKIKRTEFGCATSQNKVVVGGGWNGSNFLASTEILNTQDLTWTPGPKLPTAVFGLSMVESANGILAIGGEDENGFSKSIHRLSCNEGNDCQWEHKGDLNHGRTSFSVIPITSELANVLPTRPPPTSSSSSTTTTTTTSTTTSTTSTTTTPLDDDTLLQSHFNLLTLLGYRCFKNSEISFACEKNLET